MSFAPPTTTRRRTTRESDTRTAHVRMGRRSSRDCARSGVAALDLLPLRRPSFSSALSVSTPPRCISSLPPPSAPPPPSSIVTPSSCLPNIGGEYLLWSSFSARFTLSPIPPEPPSSSSTLLAFSPLILPWFRSGVSSLRIRRASSLSRRFTAFLSYFSFHSSLNIIDKFLYSCISHITSSKIYVCAFFSVLSLFNADVTK